MALAMCLLASPAGTTGAGPGVLAGAARPQGLGLEHYRLRAGPISIAGVTNNASGITYCEDSQTLFLVRNDPPAVFEVEPDGSVKRIIELKGFEDTEDITYVGAGQFAVIEERRRTLCLIAIPPEATAADRAAATCAVVDAAPAGNAGIEGVTYDAGGQRFFVVKEKLPRRLYEAAVTNLAALTIGVSHPWDAEAEGMGCSDLAGVYWHSASGHLLLVSDESNCIVEATPQGREVARLPLRSGSAGLTQDVAQPEGITMDAEGTLYLCSEPDQLYIFVPGRR
jgi:uncharacterized protein YjiK